MSEYTKGPWEVKKDSSYEHVVMMPELTDSGRGHKYAACGGGNNEANAHLISAAPEMYEALKEIYQCHTCLYSTGLDTGDCPDHADGNNPCSAYKLTDKEIGYYMKQANKALQKAEGKS